MHPALLWGINREKENMKTVTLKTGERIECEAFHKGESFNGNPVVVLVVGGKHWPIERNRIENIKEQRK